MIQEIVLQIDSCVMDIEQTELKSYDLDFTKIFNTILEKFNKNTAGRFEIKLYKTISIKPKLEGDKESIAKKRDYLESSNEYRLFIREDIFFNPELLRLFLIHELYFQVLSFRLEGPMASDVAMAILWDRHCSNNWKDNIFRYWRMMHPPFKFQQTHEYFLADFVSTIHRKSPGLYSENMITQFLKKIDEGKILSINYPYSTYMPTLQDLSTNEFNVLKTMIKFNSHNQKLLSEQSGLSRTTISKSISTLSHTFLLRRRVSFSPKKMGFISIFGIINSSRNKGENVSKFDYPLTKTITQFRGSEDISYINFYMPDNIYARDHLYDWLKHGMDYYFKTGDHYPDGLKIQCRSEPVFGIEKEEFRVNIQRPELYDQEERRWRVGEGFPVSRADTTIDLEWTPEKREVALKMIERPYSKEDIFKFFGGNRNKIFHIIAELEDKGVISQDYVTPFFSDLTRVMLVYNADRWDEFMETVISTLPLSVNYVIERIGDEKLTGISFLSIPNDQVTRIFSSVELFDKTAMFNLFPKNIENTPNIKVKPRQNGWKFIKLPTVLFSREE